MEALFVGFICGSHRFICSFCCDMAVWPEPTPEPADKTLAEEILNNDDTKETS